MASPGVVIVKSSVACQNLVVWPPTGLIKMSRENKAGMNEERGGRLGTRKSGPCSSKEGTGSLNQSGS